MTLSDSERAALNAEGAQRGCYACPVCGDSMLGSFQPFHFTPYHEGPVATATDGHAKLTAFPRVETRVAFHGIKQAHALCEACWSGMTPEERLPHYLKLFDLRVNGVASVKRKRLEDQKTVVDCPDDIKRRERELAEIAAERELLIAAVLAGK